MIYVNTGRVVGGYNRTRCRSIEETIINSADYDCLVVRVTVVGINVACSRDEFCATVKRGFAYILELRIFGHDKRIEIRATGKCAVVYSLYAVTERYALDFGTICKRAVRDSLDLRQGRKVD